MGSLPRNIVGLDRVVDAVPSRFQSTTILAVLRDGKLAVAGDGQVTFDKTVMKHSARKVRRIADGRAIAGFAGSAADGITLLEKFESKLNEYKSNIVRAAVELAKDWRQDRALRRLEALLIVGTADHLFVLSGTGDVIEPDDGIAAVGSGGPYAQAAAIALAQNTSLSPEEIARKALEIAGKIDIYTNADITVETL
jgi:ATP-dependent HslUV protease, peptidase subunit HslV